MSTNFQNSTNSTLHSGRTSNSKLFAAYPSSSLSEIHSDIMAPKGRQAFDSSIYLFLVLFFVAVVFISPIFWPEIPPAAKNAFLIWLAWRLPFIFAIISLAITTYLATQADTKTTSVGRAGDIISGIAAIYSWFFGWKYIAWDLIFKNLTDPKNSDYLDISNSADLATGYAFAFLISMLLVVVFYMSYCTGKMVLDRILMSVDKKEVLRKFGLMNSKAAD